MILQVNPLECGSSENPGSQNAIDKQTVEFRSADGSADIYYVLAGLVVAARTGFEMPDALQTAARTYVDRNIHDYQDSLNTLEQLPHRATNRPLFLHSKGSFLRLITFSRRNS
jgi:glutamine synthetase